MLTNITFFVPGITSEPEVKFCIVLALPPVACATCRSSDDSGLFRVTMKNNYMEGTGSATIK